jgi:hypothetical protein
MTDGKFTESDAENDGLVKREAGQQLNSVLARESGKLYTKFRAYCEENDLDPSVVLGDMILRSIRNESFAQEVSSTVVDVEQLDKGQIRREDLELVTDIIDQFGDEEEDEPDPIDQMLQERLSAVGQGPLGNLNQQSNGSLSGKDRKIQRLEREIEQLKQEQMGAPEQNGANVHEEEAPPETEDPQDIDSLFDSDDGDNQERQEADEDPVTEDAPEAEEQDVSDLFDDDADDVEQVNLGHEEAEVDDLDEEGPMKGEPDVQFSTEEADDEVSDNE